LDQLSLEVQEYIKTIISNPVVTNNFLEIEQEKRGGMVIRNNITNKTTISRTTTSSSPHRLSNKKMGRNSYPSTLKSHCIRRTPQLMILFSILILMWQMSHIVLLSEQRQQQQQQQRSSADKIAAPARKRKNRRLLVIAAVPRDERHIFTLWSELECLTSNVDHVLVSAPTWSSKIMDKVLGEAQTTIPRFQNGDVTLEATYHTNDRYDVGLWCDALRTVLDRKDGEQQRLDDEGYEEYGLLNDSVFALREFPDLLDSLRDKNISLSSLSYSYSAKYFRGYGPQHYWVESVFRGLSQEGLRTFMNYSCVPPDHPFFCRGQLPSEQKSCIINNFEHDLAKQYPRDKVDGFFVSDAPNTTKIPPYRGKQTWANNPLYWRQLVQKSNFPIAKENVKECIADVKNPLLKQCTKYISEQKVWDWDLDWWVVQDNSMSL
jgi:hypothetical protein